MDLLSQFSFSMLSSAVAVRFASWILSESSRMRMPSTICSWMSPMMSRSWYSSFCIRLISVWSFAWAFWSFFVLVLCLLFLVQVQKDKYRQQHRRHRSECPSDPFHD